MPVRGSTPALLGVSLPFPLTMVGILVKAVGQGYPCSPISGSPARHTLELIRTRSPLAIGVPKDACYLRATKSSLEVEARGSNSEEGALRTRVEKVEFTSAEIPKFSGKVRRLALCLLPTLPTSHLLPPFTWAHSSNDLETSASSQVQSSQTAVKANPAQQQNSAPISPGAKASRRSSTWDKDATEKRTSQFSPAAAQEVTLRESSWTTLKPPM